MHTEWDRRYGEWGTSLRAAMCKALPDLLNGYLHEWQFRQLDGIFPLKAGARFLDAGCGYGRLSHPLAAKHRGALAFGLDGSGNSIELYNASLQGQGAGSVGEITHLPFADESFDMVFMVTVLMYIVEPDNQRAAIQELMRVTRRGGKLVIIENNRFGTWAFLLFGALARVIPRPHATDFSIPGVTFTRGQIMALFKSANATVTRRTGCPVFTQLLPLLFVLARLNETLCLAALGLCRTLDNALEWWSAISLYVCYEISPHT